MPPNDPHMKALEDRIKALEIEKITPKRLNMNELRKALAKEPQNPNDILLPHSVGPDLLKVRNRIVYVPPTSNPTTTENGVYKTAGQPITTIVNGGRYLVTFGCANTSGNVGCRMGLFVNGSEASSIFITAGTFPGNFSLEKTFAANDVVEIRYKIEGAGSCTFFGMFITLETME